jgi:hypothetical protein
MANRQFPYTPELKPFQDADYAWTVELHRVFGREAGQARYESRGKGEPGTTLHTLHAAREAARLAWHRSAA